MAGTHTHTDGQKFLPQTNYALDQNTDQSVFDLGGPENLRKKNLNRTSQLSVRSKEFIEREDSGSQSEDLDERVSID